MVDRITNFMMVNRNLNYINSNMNAMQKTQQQISSGKMIHSPSDDPIGTINSMSTRNEIRKVEQYQDNINNAIGFLEHTSSVLTEVEDILLQIKEIAENAASEVTTSAERTAFAFQVDQLLEELIQSANSKFGGKFIFGGTETLSGTQANSAPFNAQMSGSKIAQVIQNPDGINGQIQTIVGDGKSIVINMTGDSIFQPNGTAATEDVFQTVIELRENLLANDGNSIREKITELNNEYDGIVGQNTLAGAKVDRMQLISDQLDDLYVIEKEFLSQIEDTDVAEAILQLSTQEVALQATLQTSSKILQNSLLDYI